MSTTPLVAVAAVEAAEAQAEVAVVVMAVDAAMEAHPEADEDRAGTLDLEAMFSRILEKSQAAHGATGAMRLAVEVPDPFLDCVDTDDHGTLLHGASCVELPVRDLREVFFGAPGRAQPVGADWTPESTVPRPRGRPAVLPPGSARNPELRMRQPGWDAQREQLTKQRPQGFEQAVEQEAPASYEGRRAGGAITSDMLDIRNQQLLQHLRTALQHAKFHGLPVAVVSDMTPEHAARWLEARNTALRGGLDTRDHMAVAWETVLQQAVRRFEATARLTWVDYTHLDLTRVFAAAVQSVYGLSLPRVSVPPLSLPSAEPQANIHPVDVVQHGVKPLESRRQLSATSSELQQLREVQRSAYPDYPEYDRHRAFYVDCKLTVIVIGGVRILMALLDTGCDYNGVHRRVVDRMKPGEADATLQSMSMQGIGGKMEMQRLVGRISYVINPDTDWERKFEWPSFAILEGDHLPDVILCTSVMAHLGMVIDAAARNAGRVGIGRPISRTAVRSWGGGEEPDAAANLTSSFSFNSRIELQPDNVGADAAVQLEQHDDDAELPELVADSDGEEDFVPCWVEEVPDHVANVIASCFTLRASPMDVDSDSDEELPGLVEDSSDDDDVYEELPDLMEDSSDDDDVYVELTIMTRMEPEVETTLDSEPLAAGACYALRAEGPGADNLQEHDCPSDDEELEDGTAMPLKEHEDEIPGWRELRTQRQAAGRLHLSGHTLERLALVRAVPHSTPELTYIIDLDRTGGKEGRAKQGLFLFAGMLSVLFTNLVDGYHYELIQIVDRMLRSVAHRQRLLRQLEWMHQRWPVQLPRNAFEKCFALSDELEHDVEHITAPAILRHLPELDELRAEPPCQDVSSMGTQHGLRGARTGVIVPLAEAMSELNCMLAKARGVKEYWAAPAQYGYIIENVIPAAPSRRSPEVQEFIDFMARVFGEPNAHHAHKCGDASLRSALWWTNTFTQHYYQAVQHEFERPPRETYAQTVERCSGGLLRAQVATPTRPGTLLGGLNVAGRRMIYAPKSVSTPNTRTQRLRPGGAPGSGMVEVVGIDPPQYRPSSAVMREACLLDRDYAGFYTRQELGFSEEEMVIAIGNVCAPTSVSVMNRDGACTPFVLHTDWSRAGVGACLSQVDDNGVEYAVSFASRMNTPVEADLSSYEGEVGAVVWAVQRFRYYLYGNHFQLITDCKAMEWLRTTARLRGKLARWSLILAEYDLSIKHRPGKDNTVPDLLSRRPMLAEPVRATSEAAGTATAIATQRRSPAAMADVSAMFGGCSSSKCLGRTPALPSAHAAFATQCIAMAFTAGVYASQELHWPTRDVWSSPVAISYLRGETTPADVSVEVWQQLVRRCAKYSWHNDKVWLHTGDTAREVPKPEERPDAIRRVHASIGHLGRDRTYQVLARHFVWPGMHKDVGAMVKQCRACDRVKASFNQKHDRLKPMPLFGLFYRFSVDSAGPLPTSSEGHKYVIVIVEHFSKWIELVPVRDLEATTTAKAFHERVLARYGAPVEVVTDNGTKYQGAFREQLERHGIQPVDIPPGHPQANGMAERIVQVLKVALRKVVPTLGTASWHSWMPVIEFGYRVSKQATTGYSPFFLLFGRDHVAPDQVRALLEEPVDMDNDIAVINLITQRADMLRAAMPKAFERALQAQQRDVVRYRKVRRGDVQPRRHRFEIGSYVYVAQPPLNTLDVRTARTILRVVEILESGWLRLSGSDGNEIQVHMDNCAPCHLSNLVPARYGRGMPACKGCGSDSIAAPRLICDKCQAMWHVACAKAELHPGEEWLCPDCAPPLRR
eukprot:jgi/Tetstr1/461861/TSEL_006940.t1